MEQNDMAIDVQFLDGSENPRTVKRSFGLPVEEQPAGWTATDTQDNATATATRAGVGGQKHYVTGLHASFSAAAIKTLTLKDGSTVLQTFHVHNQRDIALPHAVEITAGSAASAVLAASGTGGVLGAVNLSGYTRPA
jgi:hypothetical protein